MGVNMLLTIGGIILLSTFILYASGLMSDNVKISSDNEYVITAIGLGQSLIEEAKLKAFDEATAAGTVNAASQLSAANILGSDNGETVQNPDTAAANGSASFAKFDDVDDYNGYVRIVNTPRAENYRVRATVNYASETYPDSVKTIQTFCKRMTVTVTSAYFPQPVNLYYSFTY